MKPSKAELVRLKRGSPGSWTYYYPGFRTPTSAHHAPAAAWYVERLKSFVYRVSTARLDKPREFRKLDAVRAFIASHYEYLP